MVTTPPHWTDRRAELAAKLGKVPRLLVASDFDGTLAAIQARPGDVFLPEENRAVLRALAAHPGVRVALLSGRTLDDLARLADLPPCVVLAGNHGMEMRGMGLDYVHPQAIASRPQLDAAATQLRGAAADIPGALVEDKGLTLSLHYRLVEAADLPRVAAASDLCAEAFPTLVRRSGKMVDEFRPDIVCNKGTALQRLMKGLGLPAAATLYMGDDTTDEDAFAVLQGPGTSLHVGDRPDTLARYRLRDPEDASEFLRWLLDLRVKG